MKSKIKFPCHYPIKVIGEECQSFTSEVCDIITEQTEIIDIKKNISKGERYVSLSIVLVATDEALIKTLFKKISSLSFVKMVL